MLRLFVRFCVIRQELLQADVSQWVLQQAQDRRKWASHYVCARFSRIHDVFGVADGSSQDLGVEALDGVDFGNFADQRHTDKTKLKEMQEKTLPELMVESRSLRQEIFNLRLQQASAQLEKPARLRTLRRDIARVETRISALRNKAA